MHTSSPRLHMSPPALLVRRVFIVLLHHMIFLSHHVTAFTLGACDGNPCMNGGQCVDMGTEVNPKQFTCACSEGYTGLTCQKRIDPCADEPCQNGGICEPRGEHFHCSCSERFKGKLCEQYIRKRNPCMGDPCGAHGFCEVVNYDFICQCSPGFHGSRCEFQEEPEVVEEEEEEPVLVEEEQDDDDSKKALIIGEVVLALFIVFVVILLLLCIHGVRVANMRSKHQALQELMLVAGKETESTPGWFETSNDLCYNFWCYCCKLVSKYENDACKAKLIVGEEVNLSANLADAKLLNELGSGSAGKVASARSSRLLAGAGGGAGVGPGANGSGQAGRPSLAASRAGSKQGSRAGSRTGSRPGSKAASVPGSPVGSGDFPACDENDPTCNLTGNMFEGLEYFDQSQNRAVGGGAGGGGGSRYSVGRGHYPGRSSRSNSRRRPQIRMLDALNPLPGGRTARGALPGFQPGSQYQSSSDQRRGSADEGLIHIPPPHKMRVRRYLPAHGRSNKAVVDILDCDDEDDEDDDEGDEDFDEDDDGNGSAMVGPAGNILPMAVRGGVVGMGRGSSSSSVDQLYFDDSNQAQCLNQSNSFGAGSGGGGGGGGGGGCGEPYLDRDGNYYDPRKLDSCRNDPYHGEGDNPGFDDGDRIGLRGSPRNNYDDSDSDDDRRYEYPGSEEDDDDEEDGDDHGDGDNAGDDDVDDDDDYGDVAPYPYDAPTRSVPPQRRSRRNIHRTQRRHDLPDVADDDGYSSTGNVIESDAGGRSRDPPSMETVTRQAQRNFYSRQIRPHPHGQQAPPPPKTRPHGRVSRHEIVAGNRSRRGQDGSGACITLSPYPAAAVSGATSPHSYPNSAPCQPHHNSDPSRSASPFTVAPTRSSTPLHHHHRSRAISPSSSSQQQHQQQYQRHYQDNKSISSRRDNSSDSHSSSRRPRSSQAGWDNKTSPATISSSEQQQQQQQFSSAANSYDRQQRPPCQPAPPVRKPKVKGILKKTSAYGRPISAAYSSTSRPPEDGPYRQTSRGGYNYPPRRQMRYPPPPYAPPAYDEFVS